MSYKTVLFDVDNTLIDSATIASKILTKITAPYGYNISVSTFRNLVGIPTDKILQQLGVNPVDEIAKKFSQELRNHKNKLSYFSGIQSLLSGLQHAGLNTGIVTSRTMDEVKSDLGNFPEITFSKIIVTADKTTEHKPNGAPLEFAVNQYALKKSETIYVGDAIYDLQAAKNANIDFASATWGALSTTDFSSAVFQPNQPEDLLHLLIS